MNYIIQKFSELNEVSSFGVADFFNTTLGFIATGYYDTIEKIINDGIKYILEEPKEDEFEYTKNTMKKQIMIQVIDFTSYTINVAESFLNKGMEIYDNPEETIKKLDNITFESFKNLYHDVFSNITSISFKA